MNDGKLIYLLKKWLEIEGNSPAVLSAKLGYKTSSAISMWFQRDNIPVWQRQRVRHIISKGKKR